MRGERDRNRDFTGRALGTVASGNTPLGRAAGETESVRRAARLVVLTVGACVATLAAAVPSATGSTGTPSTAAATVSSTTATSVPAASTSAAVTTTSALTVGAPSGSTSTTTIAGSTTTVGGGASTSTPSTLPTGSTSTSTSTSSTSTTSTSTTTTTRAPFKPGKLLGVGSRGEAVEALEQRLDLLKYDVGKVDGRYDGQTWQAVLAFQKVHGLRRTGRFDAKTQEAFSMATTAGGLVPNGGLPRVEVDLTRQVMFTFDKFGLYRVSNISSGSGKKYCEYSKKSKREVCGSARTPRGNYRVQRRIRGIRESDLGKLYSPVYFNGGIAVHGSPNVPGFPASHGCVRVTNKTADWFFDEVSDGTPVYVYD